MLWIVNAWYWLNVADGNFEDGDLCDFYYVVQADTSEEAKAKVLPIEAEFTLCSMSVSPLDLANGVAYVTHFTE